MNRKAVVAGMFYKGSFDELSKEIENCFKGKFGPGDLPVKRGKKKIFGVIAPHAGYGYSGSCAAWSYKEIAESEFPELFVIIGVNHSGLGAEFSTYYFADWESPFGVVKVDKDFGKKLTTNFKYLKNEAEAHMNEHSVEVQLPFLQFANKDKIKELKFLPIVIKSYDYEKCVELGKKIAETANEMNKKIVVIASGDLTHYGVSYGYMPFSGSKENIKKNLYELDKEAIESVKRFDSLEFYRYVKQKKATVCGLYSIICAVECCKKLGSKRARLLQYYTSGDVSGDYSNAVGYGAMVFE